MRYGPTVQRKAFAHPGGSAEFPYADDRRTTAVISDSGYVAAGTKLLVREVQGNRVVVRPVTPA